MLQHTNPTVNSEIAAMNADLEAMRNSEDVNITDAMLWGHLDGQTADCQVSALYTPRQGEWTEYLVGFVQGAAEFGRTQQAEAALQLLECGFGAYDSEMYAEEVDMQINGWRN